MHHVIQFDINTTITACKTTNVHTVDKATFVNLGKQHHWDLGA